MAATVVNMSAPVFIGTPQRIVELMRAFGDASIVNMDSPNFIVLAQEPNDQQLAKAIATTAVRNA